MLQPGPNDALSQNFMKLGLLVTEKKRGQTDTQTDKPTRFMFYKCDPSLIPFSGSRNTIMTSKSSFKVIQGHIMSKYIISRSYEGQVMMGM